MKWWVWLTQKDWRKISCIFFPVSLSVLSSYRHVPCSICQCLIKPSHPWSPVNILYCTQPHLYPPTSRRTLLHWASLSLYSLSTHAWWVRHSVHVSVWQFLKLHALVGSNWSLSCTFLLPASTEGREWSWPQRGPAPYRDLLLPSISSPTSAASVSALTVSSSRASASGASLWSGKLDSWAFLHIIFIFLFPVKLQVPLWTFFLSLLVSHLFRLTRWHFQATQNREQASHKKSFITWFSFLKAPEGTLKFQVQRC